MEYIRKHREQLILAGVLFVGLIHGLIYVVGIPPWQYNEEPSHFEYAWLIASDLSLPEFPAYDQEKRREIAASMIEHKFFANLGYLPDLNAADEPIWIGTNVTGALPLYHILAAVPLRLIINADVDIQLYTLRLFSLFLFEIVLILAYLIASELFPSGHTLRWLTPATMALLPGFVHLMASVNNDVGATFMFSLFLWTGVRLVKHGINPGRFIALIITTIFCCLTKNTVIVALPLAALAFWFSLIKSKWALVLGLFLILGGFIAVVGIFTWGDAAYWYRISSQQESSRVITTRSPVGDHAFLVEANPGENESSAFIQLLPSSSTEMLKGKKVTCGAWIWAEKPMTVKLPVLFDGTTVHAQTVEVTTEPMFYWMTVPVSANAPRVEIRLLTPVVADGSLPAKIYYDGILIVTGKWPLDRAPVYINANAKRGSWGEKMFINAVRNASAESAWLYVRPWFESLIKKVPWLAHLSPNELLASTMDVASSRWLYLATIKKLSETFWAKFAWESISLSQRWYQVLNIITLVGLLTTSVVAPFRIIKASHSTRISIIWLGITFTVFFIIVLLRGFFGIYDVKTYIPVARYGYPVIIPMMMVLCYGWRTILKWMGYWCTILIIGGFIILDITSILVWFRYFIKL